MFARADLQVPTIATRDLTLESSFSSLLLSLLLNSSLMALKSSTPLSPADARLAVKQATRALALDGDAEQDGALRTLADGEKAKALYRRAVGLVAVKEDAEAVRDLERAAKLVKGDGAVDAL